MHKHGTSPRARMRGHDVFAAVGDPTRRRVLDLLADSELTAGEIAAPFAITRPAVSQHLGILLRAGLVSTSRQGRERIYRLSAGPLREVYDWVEHYERFWAGKLSALGKYLDKSPDAETPK